jgi:hypothetical protein
LLAQVLITLVGALEIAAVTVLIPRVRRMRAVARAPREPRAPQVPMPAAKGSARVVEGSGAAAASCLTIVAHLSDRCDACRIAVPGLNRLRRRLLSLAEQRDLSFRFEASVSGDGRAFAGETALEYPVVARQNEASSRPRRVPWIAVSDAHGAVLATFAPFELHAVEERVLSLVVPGYSDRSVQAQLDDATEALFLADGIDPVIAWELEPEGDAAWERDRAGAGADLRVRLAETAARDLLSRPDLPLVGALAGDYRFAGDLKMAAELVLRWSAADVVGGAGLAHRLVSPDTLESGLDPSEEALNGVTVVATALAAMDPARRARELTALWDYQRAAGELAANTVRDTFLALVDLLASMEPRDSGPSGDRLSSRGAQC